MDIGLQLLTLPPPLVGPVAVCGHRQLILIEPLIVIKANQF